jgi:hypothetical protein
VALTSLVSISRPGIVSDFAPLSNNIACPARNDSADFPLLSIFIMPLKRDFDLSFITDFDNTLPLVLGP